MRNDGTADKDSTNDLTDLKCCVWMMAGVMSFKLCPLEYDCERCDFDRVLRMKKPLGDPGPLPATDNR